VTPGAALVAPEPWHAAHIAEHARQADIDELWAASHSTPLQVLEFGMAYGSPVVTGLWDGVPVCMFGVMPLSVLGAIGAPWMVGTSDIDRLQVPFLRRSRPYLAAMRERYDVLVNNVDDRNEAAKRWLRWIGFTLGDPVPHGPDGVPFRPFHWRRVRVDEGVQCDV
jgi:hypothetical protein